MHAAAMKSGNLKWEGGRLILEVDVTIRVPVEIVAVAERIIGTANLTKREQHALAGLLKGWGNKELANEMGISERTAKYHVSSLLRKFEVPTRGELMAMFGKNRAGGENA